jgi:DNA modification methylase
MIQTIGYNETEIQENILKLFSDLDYYELDPCYSTGVFYKRGLKQPRLKFDINPQSEDTQNADVRSLPLEDESVKTIMFDPPFVIGVPNGSKDTEGSNKTFNRFSGFNTKNEQAKFYYDSLKELHRVLKQDGIIAFKCQDTVSSGKQYMVHFEIIAMAQAIGFYVKDLFILCKKHRMNSGKWNVQRHARKHHCYYLVLQKVSVNPIAKNLNFASQLFVNEKEYNMDDKISASPKSASQTSLNSDIKSNNRRCLTR